MFKLMGKKIFTFYTENVCLSKPVHLYQENDDNLVRISPNEGADAYVIYLQMLIRYTYRCLCDITTDVYVI